MEKTAWAYMWRGAYLWRAYSAEKHDSLESLVVEMFL